MIISDRFIAGFLEKKMTQRKFFWVGAGTFRPIWDGGERKIIIAYGPILDGCQYENRDVGAKPQSC